MIILSLLLSTFDPCDGARRLLFSPLPAVACDAADNPIQQACHCVTDDKWKPWPASKQLVLTMQKEARVKAGQWHDLTFRLTNTGSQPITVTLSGGAVVSFVEAWRGGKQADRAPCVDLERVPPLIRVTLQPNGNVHGTTTWRASSDQGNCPVARNLPHGRYSVKFKTASGDPELTADVDVTVID